MPQPTVLVSPARRRYVSAGTLAAAAALVAGCGSSYSSTTPGGLSGTAAAAYANSQYTAEDRQAATNELALLHC